MADELRLKTHHNPGIFNKDMLLGGLIVSALPIGLLIPGMGIGATLALAAAKITGGALIGGTMGKNRLENENRYGKKVGEPSFWNKDTAIGGLLGLKVTGLIALATLGVSAVVGVASGAALPIMGTGLILALTSLVVTPIAGMFIGGRLGKSRMENEYTEAKKQQIVEQISQSVSPEVGQAVGYTMEHKKDWAKTIMEEKLLSAVQEPSR